MRRTLISALLCIFLLSPVAGCGDSAQDTPKPADLGGSAAKSETPASNEDGKTAKSKTVNKVINDL